MREQARTTVTEVQLVKHPYGGIPRWIFGALGLVGILLGFLSWAVSSPQGSSPDDDYHMGSIWCPRPIEGGQCDYRMTGDEISSVMVPESASVSAVCYARLVNINGSCVEALDDELRVETTRFDNGMYPRGYYQFHHLLVGRDVSASVVWMRVANALLGVGGIFLAGVLAPSSVRRTILIAATVAWVPMGVYFISSINPSSWAISGALIYVVSLVAAVLSERWRQWALLVLATFGAFLAIFSRADSPFYIAVITLAVWILLGPRRMKAPAVVTSAVLATLGLAVFAGTGQAGNLTADGGWPVSEEMTTLRLFVSEIASLPELVGGLWGLTWGPGWFDVPLLGWSTLSMIFLAGGVFLTAATNVGARRGGAAVLVAGALLGVPVVSMNMRRVALVYYYQPRYVLPLLAVFFFVWLWSNGRRGSFDIGGRTWVVVFLASVSNFFALRQLITRYALGLPTAEGQGLPTFFDVLWWPWSIPPEVVLWGGSIAFALGLSALTLATSYSLVSSTDRTRSAK